VHTFASKVSQTFAPYDVYLKLFGKRGTYSNDALYVAGRGER